MQVIQHVHVQVEVMHRNVPVLGHHQVQADDPRIGLRQFEASQHLSKDRLAGQPAEDLIKKAYGYGAARVRILRSTLQQGMHPGYVFIELLMG